MRIALFTDTFIPEINGVAKTYQRLIPYLHAHNIDTIVYAPCYKTDECDDNSSRIVRIPGMEFPLYRGCKVCLPDYPALQRTLDHQTPDLIHLATPFSLGITGLIYAKQHNIPKVAAFHTDFPRFLEYYGLPQCKKLAWRFLRWFHFQAEKNYCPSVDTMRMLQLQGIKHVELWSRGVDCDLFNPAFRSRPFRQSLGIDEKTVLLYVGRLAPEKSVDILLQAFSLANQACDNLHLLIVGDGPSEKSLREQAPDNVSFLGALSGVELSTAYASAEFFICPSTTETFGNVILEAMASSLPVIASLSGGIKQNLYPLQTGLACLPQNPASMADSMNQLIRDAALRNRLAQQAYDHAKKQSWDEVFSRLVESYRHVLSKKRKLSQI